jgi:hypothetical protein
VGCGGEVGFAFGPRGFPILSLTTQRYGHLVVLCNT